MGTLRILQGIHDKIASKIRDNENSFNKLISKCEFGWLFELHLVESPAAEEFQTNAGYDTGTHFGK